MRKFFRQVYHFLNSVSFLHKLPESIIRKRQNSTWYTVVLMIVLVFLLLLHGNNRQWYRVKKSVGKYNLCRNSQRSNIHLLMRLVWKSMEMPLPIVLHHYTHDYKKFWHLRSYNDNCYKSNRKNGSAFTYL